jgi:hypothetical protein
MESDGRDDVGYEVCFRGLGGGQVEVPFSCVAAHPGVRLCLRRRAFHLLTLPCISLASSDRHGLASPLSSRVSSSYLPYLLTHLLFCGSRCGQMFGAPWTLASRSSCILLTSLLSLSNRSLPPSLPSPLPLPPAPSPLPPPSLSPFRCARTSHLFGARTRQRDTEAKRQVCQETRVPRDTCAKRHVCAEARVRRDTHLFMQASLPYPVPSCLSALSCPPLPAVAPPPPPRLASSSFQHKMHPNMKTQKMKHECMGPGS